MTLRDCTLFVQIPRELISYSTASANVSSTAFNTSNGHQVDAHEKITNGFHKSRQIRTIVADLDEKSETCRGDYWKSLEEQLILGGYYLGKGKLGSKVENCDLSDNAWTADQVKWNGFTCNGEIKNGHGHL